MKKQAVSRKKKTSHNADIELNINKIIAKIARVKESDIKDDIKIRDHLGIDSLNATEILAAIEVKYGITIDEAQAFNIETVRDLYDLVNSHIKKI